MDIKDYWTVRAMMQFGGSFIKGLAVCVQSASRDNLKKIKDTWPEYMRDYEEIGQKMRYEVCSYGECDGSGEVTFDEDDGEGHLMKATGVKKCLCKEDHD